MMALPPVAILAGGLATRLMPMTQAIPKSLVPVAGRPFVLHQLALLKEHGFQHVVLCLGHLGEQVQTLLGDGSQFGLRVQYSFDGPTLLGTGGALMAALPKLGEAFLVLYGDSYLMCDYAAVWRAFLASQMLGLMTVCRIARDARDEHEPADTNNPNNVCYADGRVLAYDKHNSTSQMQHIDFGLNAFRASAFARYAPNTPLDLATVQHDLANAGQLAGYEVLQRFYEIGSVAGLLETQDYLETRELSPTPRGDQGSDRSEL